MYACNSLKIILIETMVFPRINSRSNQLGPCDFELNSYHLPKSCLHEPFRGLEKTGRRLPTRRGGRQGQPPRRGQLGQLPARSSPPKSLVWKLLVCAHVETCCSPAVFCKQLLSCYVEC